MASTTAARAASLPVGAVTTPTGGALGNVVENFAVFIDTHRDQPHVPTFGTDIHRGMCQPVVVHYGPARPPARPDPLLFRASDGATINLDEQHHKFISIDWWTSFVLDYMQAHGTTPLDGDGMMPTSHLRDARAKRYLLRSFRQIVVEHQRNQP